MTSTTEPHIRELDRAEIDAILARNHVGRMAYDRRGRIEIEPIHYVFADGSLYLRTSHGEKYRTMEQSFYSILPVAFEVDEVEELFRWRSVVVHGSAYLVPHPREGGDPADWSSAVAQLRKLHPAALTGSDPVPNRNLLFRISVQEATGRECTPPADAEGPDADP
jgi:nitroimidazol reductase NimA-like FMN-containing flavoprotein (pyridoxamine 5'-phosphate oxidase superfamily)